MMATPRKVLKTRPRAMTVLQLPELGFAGLPMDLVPIEMQ
jgi:hypothetical protein